MNHRPTTKEALIRAGRSSLSLYWGPGKTGCTHAAGAMMASSHFERKLTELRKELTSVEKAGNEAAETVVLDQTRVGRLSRMDALQNQAISIEVKRRRENQLRQIDSALARLKNGKFGFCVDCGEKINARRLEFDPTSTLCIEFATKAES